MSRFILTIIIGLLVISNNNPFFSPPEICNNGLDDNQNGFVDCFDPACDCNELCENNYYYKCDTNCILEQNNSSFELELEWESSNRRWHEYNVPIVADIDGDGIPEIIGKSGPHVPGPKFVKNFQIFDGVTGKFKQEIITPYFDYTVTAPAIADVDNNGYADIIFMFADHPSNRLTNRKLVCYEYNNGSIKQKWISNVQIPRSSNISSSTSPNLADFNQDGIPEVYVSNYIFNATNGKLLTKPIGRANTGAAYVQFFDHITRFVVAADVLDDKFCPNCKGLELIAGNQVFSVLIDPIKPSNNRIKVEVRGSFGKDGYTAIADIDRDGDLDAVITWNDNNRIFVNVWDLQTSKSLANSFSSRTQYRNVGLANIGDFDNDGFPDICFTDKNNLRVIKLNNGTLSEMWKVRTTDGSGLTGCTLFDFNGDQIFEVIYRDENVMKIFNGATGNILYSTFCTSGTAWEYPVVADVDADGETELICGCGGKLKVWGSASKPWVPTRSVWNQHMYFNVNINDDLTIPIQQQQHHIVGDSVEMNTFLNQYSDPLFPAADAYIIIDSSICNNDEIDIYITICNTGSITLSKETPISFYEKNPSIYRTTKIKTIQLGTNIAIGECIEIVISIPKSTVGTLYFVVNDDGSQRTPYNFVNDFPITSIAECDFTNNIDSIDLNIEVGNLDLGTNQLLCDRDTFLLDAGKGFRSYLWQDGSTNRMYLVESTGWYVVEVLDDCEKVLIDSIFISLTNSQYIYDTVNICTGDTLIINGNKIFTAGDYDELLTDQNNCDSIIYFHVILNIDAGSLDLGIDQMLCDKDTFQLDAGNEFKSYKWQDGSTETTYLAQSTGWYKVEVLDECDNVKTDSVYINMSLSQYRYDTLSLCKGDSITINGEKVFESGDYTELLIDHNKCDSSIYTHLIIENGFLDYNAKTICHYDSINFYNKWYKTTGRIEHRIGQAECDSVFILDLIVLDEISIETSDTMVCDSSDIIAIDLQIKGGVGQPYQVDWGKGVFTNRTTQDLPVGEHSINIKDSLGCLNKIKIRINVRPKPKVTILKQDNLCHGDSNANISIEILESQDWLYSINGNEFLETNVFTNLKSGDYYIRMQSSYKCTYDTLISIIEPNTLNLNLPSDTTINLGDIVEIDPTINRHQDSLEFKWIPEEGLDCYTCKDVVASPFQTTKYTLIITDRNGCTTSREIIIYVKNNWNVYVPNVFTPNSDGINDGVTVFASKSVKEIQLFQIYDRWGELVFSKSSFEPNNTLLGWNGRFNNQLMNPGVFVYVASVILINDEIHTVNGNITLVR